MNAWTTLVSDNPMLAEFYRRARRFALSKNNRQNILISAGSLILVYVMFVLVFAQAPFFQAWGIAIVKLPLFAVVVPLVIHGAVAGERDKRSWDAICAAPLTDAQIVAGKFLSCVAVIAFIDILFLPVQLACLTMEKDTDRMVDLVAMGRLDLYTTAMALFIAAVTFLASARSKRPFTALGAVIGLFAGMMAVSIITVMGSNEAFHSRFYTPIVALFNPIVHVSAIIWRPDQNDEWVKAVSGGVPFVPEFGAVIYLLLGAAALVFATKTLHHADHEAIVSPQAKKNA